MPITFPSLGINSTNNKWRIMDSSHVFDIKKVIEAFRHKFSESEVISSPGMFAASVSARQVEGYFLQKTLYTGEDPVERLFWKGYAETAALSQRKELWRIEELFHAAKINLPLTPATPEKLYFGGFYALESIGIEASSLPHRFDSTKSYSLQEALRIYMKNRL